ncbi:MAG: AbrB/MazE/SpoVT family DNA-binding domain-containing protein [Bifidobacteriaceae bacterium]|jgi:bifunctional DNA-binding transcriptional regulator/antitoxin component of YhaV-PrlF toxin-antitoxin module|nr:AbrB/MazE/SpoVT family DNA-binding domain-containing protein [Bifidobacteriaceae bacterium]
MSETVIYDTKLGPGGRAVIPAPLRKHLGLRIGDRLHFQVVGTDVRLATDDDLLKAVWEKNGGSGETATAQELSVADWRAEDATRAATRRERLDVAAAADQRDPHHGEDDLLDALGLE